MKSNWSGMRISRLRYLLTWISLAVLLICGILMMTVSWNRTVAPPSLPILLVILWLLISASGIFLFMLAVKKAHRLLVDEERSLKEPSEERNVRSIRKKETDKDFQELDFASTARKLVRRTPEKAKMEDVGKQLLKNLGNELEIMSGVFYLRRKGRFEATSVFALSSHSEPYVFKEGEGLTGQVARSQQLMVITRLPEDYLEVYSGLGKAQPSYVAIVPFISKGRTLAVLECSGFKYDPHAIENMFRILARDLMEKLSPNLS